MPQLPTIWKGCLIFSTTIFFILPNSAKYTYGWMIATWATSQKLGGKKKNTLLLPELKHLWLLLENGLPNAALDPAFVIQCEPKASRAWANENCTWMWPKVCLNYGAFLADEVLKERENWRGKERTRSSIQNGLVGNGEVLRNHTVQFLSFPIWVGWHTNWCTMCKMFHSWQKNAIIFAMDLTHAIADMDSPNWLPTTSLLHSPKPPGRQIR